MSTSDRTHDPLGLGERPPTRYDEEGKSLPERGSGRPALDAALAAQNRDPEKLALPAELVGDLLQAAIATQLGNALWRGFVAAHGYPEWIVAGAWAIKAQGAEVVRAAAPAPAGANGTAPR